MALTLGVKVVVFPQWTQLMLSTNVPHSEFDVFVLKRLHVKANGGYGVNKLLLLELEQYAGLACTIQTQHNHSHLHVRPNVHMIVLHKTAQVLRDIYQAVFYNKITAL